jgi:hypothetical protein
MKYSRAALTLWLAVLGGLLVVLGPADSRGCITTNHGNRSTGGESSFSPMDMQSDDNVAVWDEDQSPDAADPYADEPQDDDAAYAETCDADEHTAMQTTSADINVADDDCAEVDEADAEKNDLADSAANEGICGDDDENKMAEDFVAESFQADADDQNMAEYAAGEDDVERIAGDTDSTDQQDVHCDYMPSSDWYDYCKGLEEKAYPQENEDESATVRDASLEDRDEENCRSQSFDDGCGYENEQNEKEECGYCGDAEDHQQGDRAIYVGSEDEEEGRDANTETIDLRDEAALATMCHQSLNNPLPRKQNRPSSLQRIVPCRRTTAPTNALLRKKKASR